MSDNMNNGQGQNTDPSLEVNFDALSAPEGQYNPFIHGDGNGNVNNSGSNEPGEPSIPGSTEDLINGLPNLDKEFNQQQLDQQNQQQSQDQQQNQNQDPNAGQNNNQQQTSGDYWMKPFEQIKAANPEWEIPQGLNEENYLQTLQEIFTPELHPEVVKIQEAIDKGVTFDQVVEAYKGGNDMSKMTDREMMDQHFKNSYKDWDDAKIKEVLDKMENSGYLEIEAGRLRKEINEQQSSALDNMTKTFEQQRSQEVARINDERSKQINESLNIINKANDVYGLPLSQSEKVEFSEYFAKLVTPDETGMAPMFRELQSNETLVKVAAMLWKGDSKIRAALTSAKESGKASVLDKLDKTPNNVQRGGGNQDPTQVDFDALSAPERLMH
jgi:hypothetical protein